MNKNTNSLIREFIHLSTQSYTQDSITAGPGGALWFTNFGGPSIGRITTSVTP